MKQPRQFEEIRLRAGRLALNFGQSRGFFSSPLRQTDYGAHATSWSTGTGISFPGSKTARSWTWSLISM